MNKQTKATHPVWVLWRLADGDCCEQWYQLDAETPGEAIGRAVFAVRNQWGQDVNILAVLVGDLDGSVTWTVAEKLIHQ